MKKAKLEKDFQKALEGQEISNTEAQIQEILKKLKPEHFSKKDFEKKLTNLASKSVLIRSSLNLFFNSQDKTKNLKLVPAKFNDIFPTLQDIWIQVFNQQYLHWVKENDYNPIDSMGGIFIFKELEDSLRGSISTRNAKTGNPFEMVLIAKPTGSDEENEWGSQYVLIRDPFSGECKIKRRTEAHLKTGTNLPQLSPEQVKSLGNIAFQAEKKFKRPIQIHWHLANDRLFIASIDKGSPVHFYFPFREAQLSLQSAEKRILKVIPNELKWNLSSHYPLTPMGMSLDYYMIQTINQGISTCKLPLPTTLIRYVNGYRFSLEHSEKNSTFLEKLRKYFMKKNMAPLEKDLTDKYAPNYLELLKIVGLQDLRDRPTQEDRQLLDKTLRIMMKLIADSSEIRGLFILAEAEEKENGKPLSTSFEDLPFIKDLQTLGKLFQESSLDKSLQQFEQWDKILHAIITKPEGEKISQAIQHYQEAYSFLWKEGDPIDPGAEENTSLMIQYLRLSPQLFKSSKDILSEKIDFLDHPPSLRMIHYLLNRGASTFRKILLNSSEKLIKMGVLQNSNEIFMFTLEELVNLFDPSKFRMEFQKGLYSLVKERIRSYGKWLKLIPPPFLPFHPKDSPSNSNLEIQSFNGKFLHKKEAQGYVHVIRFHSDWLDISPGEIVATSTLTEGWLPFVKKAGGLILENHPNEKTITQALKDFQIPTFIANEPFIHQITNGFHAVLKESLNTVEFRDA